MRSTWLFIGLLLGHLGTATALAQDAQPADLAREHFRRGEAAYQKGSYALAISEWQAAYTADPRPRIQYNIYQAYERLGQLQEGAVALERYLSTADPDDPYYADATARMAALQQRLQATGIRLMGGVDGASINVSGHDWGRLPRPDKIPVQPGNHRIVIALAGYDDFVANVVVPPGQVVDVAVQLDRNAAQPLAATETSAPGPSAATAASDSDSGKLPLYITAGVLGAGAIGSAIWMVDRFSELSGCGDEASFCRAEDTVSTERTIAIVTTAALGAGAIGVLLVALLSGDGDAAEQKPAAALCVPTLAGASCRMSF